MSWIGFALALLKFVNSIVMWCHERELITEGQRQEVLRQTLAIAAKVHTRDQIMEQVNAMSEDEVDAGLRKLEPK